MVNNNSHCRFYLKHMFHIHICTTPFIIPVYTYVHRIMLVNYETGCTKVLLRWRWCMGYFNGKVRLRELLKKIYIFKITFFYEVNLLLENQWIEPGKKNYIMPVLGIKLVVDITCLQYILKFIAPYTCWHTMFFQIKQGKKKKKSFDICVTTGISWKKALGIYEVPSIKNANLSIK